MMFVFIKNMVCVRCKMAVKAVLETLELPYSSVELGRVELVNDLSPEQHKALHKGLQYYELELLDNKGMILAERVKNLITEIIYHPQTAPLKKLSVVLSQQLRYDYTYLSNVFTEIEGTTIERFYIQLRVKRVKELIAYENKSLKEISYILHYSSVAHLCSQFKKITGQRPSDFKRLSQSADYNWTTCE